MTAPGPAFINNFDIYCKEIQAEDSWLNLSNRSGKLPT